GEGVGLYGPDGPGQGMRRTGAERETATEAIEQVLPHRITMGGVSPVAGAPLADEGDDTIVRHLGYGEPDGVGERLLEVQRPVEDGAGGGEKLPPSGSTDQPARPWCRVPISDVSTSSRRHAAVPAQPRLILS